MNLLIKDDGTITVPSFDLPFSSYASKQARDALVARLRTSPSLPHDIAQIRRQTDELTSLPRLEKLKTLYPYSSTKSVMGGVPIETFVPASGISRENHDHILIELHGGGFVSGGGGPSGAIEAVPLASIEHIKVITVDYRMAPEHRFPAASEDVAAVYREVLKSYRPENIGIYGCSAGGLLSAEAIPWFLKEKLPLPGAIGVLCASAYRFGEGDTFQIWTRLGSVIPIVPPPVPDPDKFGPSDLYFAGASPQDPLAVPAASKDILRQFPPTLFLTGTRAPEMSSAAESHLALTELEVKSELLLFDGLDHGFYTDPALPESARAFKLIAKFFHENLGTVRSR